MPTPHNTIPDPAWAAQLRASLAQLKLPDGLADSAHATLGRHPEAIDHIINAVQSLYQRSEIFQKNPDTLLTFALAPLPHLVQRTLQAEAELAYMQHREPSIQEVANAITDMLRHTHSFVQFTMLPRALFHFANGLPGPTDPGKGLSAIAGYIHENASNLFYGLDMPQRRADALIGFVKAMANDADARNPYPTLSADVQLLALQRAMVIAASPAISGDRMADYLRPYGSLIHRLVGQSQRPGAPEFFLRSDGADPKQKLLSAHPRIAVERAISEVRNIHHTMATAIDNHNEWEHLDTGGGAFQTLGSEFDTQCRRFEELMHHLLSHPSLARHNVNTLVQVLLPISSAFIRIVQDARVQAAQQNPQVAQGNAPFLSAQLIDSWLNHLEQRFIAPHSFYASAGAPMMAAFAARFDKNDLPEEALLRSSLEQMLDYCRENKHTLFTDASGQSQPMTNHKLDLLTTLADQLCDTQNLLDSGPLERAKLFLAAAEVARRVDAPEHGWDDALILSNKQLFHLAGMDSPKTGWEPLFAHDEAAASPAKDSPLLALPAPRPSSVVPLTRTTLTPQGEKNFADRMERNAKKQGAPADPNSGPSREDLQKDGKDTGNVVSFKDLIKNKRAKEKGNKERQ